MIRIQMKQWDSGKPCQKNRLYKIDMPGTIRFVESHGDKSELVNVEYCLSDGQYGIYGWEYRGQNTEKEGCKAPDILACSVDETRKHIQSMICDVKSNISAFSDDLSKDNAVITAVKEVRDFIEQIHAGILHKNSFMLYYIDGGYREEETIGIVTRRFEPEKFRAVAEKLEQLVRGENPRVSPLIANKLKVDLRPYVNEIGSLRDFADQIIAISGKNYRLCVFPLEPINGSDAVATIKIGALAASLI